MIAETGGDMTAFAPSKHLASWAGMCPGNDESAGKRRSGKTRKGSKWLSQTLVECAKSANRGKNTYLAAQIPQAASTARREQSHDRGLSLNPDHRLAHAPNRRDLHRTRRRLRRPPRPRTHPQRLVNQLQRLGYNVTVQEGGAAASA